MSLLNRELEYFLAICETRNLARAADVLGVSQPALTRSLQRLEARFATLLFVRAPRGVELTPVGAALNGGVLTLREPVWGAAPGQTAVLLRGDVVVGCATIAR